MKGIWVFITAAIIAYPATGSAGHLFKTLSESDSCNDYTDIISHYTGKNWGIFPTGLSTFDDYPRDFYLLSLRGFRQRLVPENLRFNPDADLSQSLLYKVAISPYLVAIASGGERLLFKISGPMVVVKVGIIVVFGFCDDPALEFRQYNRLPASLRLFRDVLLTIPFCFFSAVFIQVLNPMNIAYRKREADKVLANLPALRTHRISYITLIAVILFFCLFVYLPQLATKKPFLPLNKISSALALAAQVIPGHIIHIHLYGAEISLP